MDCNQEGHTKSNGKRKNSKADLRKISSTINHLKEIRSENNDSIPTKNVDNTFANSPKVGDKIKRENQRSEMSKLELRTYNLSKSPKTMFDEKLYCNGDTKNLSANIKKEYEKFKIETGNDDDNSNMKMTEDEIIIDRKKRPSSVNSSPYKDKKRKKIIDEQHQLTPTNHDRVDSDLLAPPQQKTVAKIYYSYFERTNDDKEEMREMK